MKPLCLPKGLFSDSGKVIRIAFYGIPVHSSHVLPHARIELQHRPLYLETNESMKYTLLLWPHANARYRNESLRLALGELTLMLGRVAPDAQAHASDALGMPAIALESAAPLPDAAIAAIRGHSLLYGLFADGGGALVPLAGREAPYLGEDLPGILKYKGKTNELFTQLLVNAALYSSDYWRAETPVQLLDPMCGRGTTLFVGVNRGWTCAGSDVQRGDLREAEQFFKRYLEYHRFKHTVERSSLTLPGRRSAPGVRFRFSDTPENFRQKHTSSLSLFELDAASVRDAFGARAYHIIACDLPYGVQHAAHGGSIERLLAQALPQWRETLRPGGAVAVSFNAQTLKPDAVREAMARAGLEPLDGEPYLHFSHWVEQAVTRDLAVARRPD